MVRDYCCNPFSLKSHKTSRVKLYNINVADIENGMKINISLIKGNKICVPCRARIFRQIYLLNEGEENVEIEGSDVEMQSIQGDEVFEDIEFPEDIVLIVPENIEPPVPKNIVLPVPESIASCSSHGLGSNLPPISLSVSTASSSSSTSPLIPPSGQSSRFGSITSSVSAASSHEYYFNLPLAIDSLNSALKTLNLTPLDKNLLRYANYKETKFNEIVENIGSLIFNISKKRMIMLLNMLQLVKR